jgi:SGNH hydrolase-like domain, acetyltransferase AlgX
LDKNRSNIPGRLQPIVFTGLKLLLTIVLSFIALEASLRIFHHFNPSFVFYDRSYNRFRGKPHSHDYTFKLNSLGFKDLEYSQEKPDDVFRIISIGDSFVYGVVPYEYNFLTILDTKLNETGSFEVINMGIPGIGPREYLSVCANEGIKFDPDLVLVCFFIGNDIIEGYETREKTVDKLSYTVAFTKFLYNLKKFYTGKIIHGSTVYNDENPTFTTEKYISIEKQRSVIFLKENHKYLDQVLSENIHYLKKINTLCRHSGCRMCVVIIPDEIQLNPVLQTDTIQAMNRSEIEFDFHKPTAALMKMLSDEAIPALDLLPYFASDIVTENLFKPRDSHWNIAGNAFAAEILFTELKKQTLLQ